MRPSAVAVDIGGSDTDAPFEFEQVPYPSDHWAPSTREEELPLHYMSEEKARRRVKAPVDVGLGEYQPTEKETYEGYYDDEGKDFYSKPRPAFARVGSGRVPQPHLPPPTSLVRLPRPRCCYHHL